MEHTAKGAGAKTRKKKEHEQAKESVFPRRSCAESSSEKRRGRGGGGHVRGPADAGVTRRGEARIGKARSERETKVQKQNTKREKEQQVKQWTGRCKGADRSKADGLQTIESECTI
jgi:hypothetical protein